MIDSAHTRAAISDLLQATSCGQREVRRLESLGFTDVKRAWINIASLREALGSADRTGELLPTFLSELVEGFDAEVGLLPGDKFVATETHGGTFWPPGLYYDVSSVEREYFDMFFFTNLKSYKGAFHMSPDYAWWYGYADTLGHLIKIRDEAEQLRVAHRTASRTNFMLWTGPFMVLLVLGGIWGARTLYRRRRKTGE